MMNQTYRFVSSLFLAAAIATPVSILAAPKAQDAAVQVRVYDDDNKDYHNWDDRENERWHEYLKENREKDHEFKEAEKKEQAAYWKWRHKQLDADEHRDKDNH
jgi:hypothetical protein